MTTRCWRCWSSWRRPDPRRASRPRLLGHVEVEDLEAGGVCAVRAEVGAGAAGAPAELRRAGRVCGRGGGRCGRGGAGPAVVQVAVVSGGLVFSATDQVVAEHSQRRDWAIRGSRRRGVVASVAVCRERHEGVDRERACCGGAHLGADRHFHCGCAPVEPPAGLTAVRVLPVGPWRQGSAPLPRASLRSAGAWGVAGR